MKLPTITLMLLLALLLAGCNGGSSSEYPIDIQLGAQVIKSAEEELARLKSNFNFDDD